MNRQGSQNGGFTSSLCITQTAGARFVLGPSYSGAAFGASTVGKIFDVPLLGTTTSNPQLSNKDENTGFPTFSRVYPSDTYQGAALARVVAHYGCKCSFASVKHWQPLC